jgi:hypothetical protein
MIATIPIVEASVATVNVASELIVTSTVLQQYIARHCTSTRYGYQIVLFHRTDVCSWVRRYCNIVMVLMLQYDQYRPVRTNMHN